MVAWQEIFRKRTEDWVYAAIQPPRCPPDGTRRLPEVEKDYISIHLMSMRVVNVRAGLKTFYGVVNSYASLSHLSGGPAEFNVIISPEQLRNVDGARLDRTIQMEHQILGPVPYRGGLELETGLFSVETRDLAAEFVKLLGEASKLAGIAYVTAAMPYVGLIKSGLDMLLGNNQSTLEIGLSRQFSQPETGYYVVMRAPKNQVIENDLRIDPNDYRVSYPNPSLIQTSPYMVIRISASQQRADWHQIREISAAYNGIMDAVRSGSINNTKERLNFFKRIVLTSPDLLMEDAQRLVEKVDSQVTTIMPATGTAAGRGHTLPELSELKLYN